MKYMNSMELLGFLKKAGLPCSKSSLQRLVRERRIPHYRIPNPTSPPKFIEEEVLDWLQDRKIPMSKPRQYRNKF